MHRRSMRCGGGFGFEDGPNLGTHPSSRRNSTRQRGIQRWDENRTQKRGSEKGQGCVNDHMYCLRREDALKGGVA